MDGRRRLAQVLCIAAAMALFAFGPCGSAAASEAGDPLYVALVWHNHQPFYKNTATGMYMMPWVRMHAVKDYYDMAAMLKDYPNVHVTFNLVPSLIMQLDEYSAGAKDIQLLLTERRAGELTPDDKDFILRRFFDANWDNIIKRYPRYWELLQLRGTSVDDESIARAIATYTEQDFRDLQVWFNLAWLDPDFVEADPAMKGLAEKARGFTEADKQLVVAKHAEIVREVIPVHRQMQQTGQIEITTTAFYHPIMPLLYDTDLARIASPKLDLPTERFARPEDVEAQLALAVESYRSHFGVTPRGLWPSEQAVGQKIVDLVHDAGFSWMVSSEGVLARSLGTALRDGAGNVSRPDLLYRPYIVEEDGKQVTILFRDIVLSDKIGFSYSGMSGRAAALDLVNYLKKVKADLKDVPGPHIVTIALDGENCWEYYANDGKEFLHAMYTVFDTDPDFKAVTVQEYLAVNPATERIPVLHTGSWISDNLETWIGEAEENLAWSYLAKARRALEEATARECAGECAAGVCAAGGMCADAACDALCEPPTGQLARAWDEMYAAEGSDWFWWYGDDQSSGNDEAFDELFRIHLQNVYGYLGLAVPGYLYIPIIPKRAAVPEDKITGIMKDAVMDGMIGWGEWEKSSYYPGGPWPSPSLGDGAADAIGAAPVFESLRVGVDAENLYVRLVAEGGFDELYGQDVQIAVYMSTPRRGEVNSVPRWSGDGKAATVLGFPLGAEVMVDFANVLKPGRKVAHLALAAGDGAWVDAGELEAASVGEALEIAVPFEALGIRGADAAVLAAVATRGGRNVDVIPSGGPAEFRAPMVSMGKRLFLLEDARGDDYGPGCYTYPTNAVFTPGCFDMASFECVESADEVTFNVGLATEIINPWNSGIGLSVQTIDIYIDTDHVPGSGLTDALGGRRVKFEPESAWEYAIWVEGWNQRVFASDGSEVGGITAAVDAVNNVVSITVPKSIIGSPEPGWGFQVFVLGQEGFPSQGNLRVREVVEQAAEWRFGGGDNGIYDPNVIDMLVPAGRSQEEMLSDFDVKARRLAEVPMVYPEF